MPKDWEFKRFSVDMANNCSLIVEFWILGVLHQFARVNGMNSNTNSPEIGYFVTMIMVVFYGAKAIGNFIGILIIQLGASKILIHIFYITLIIMSMIEPRNQDQLQTLIFRGMTGVSSSVSVMIKVLEIECRTNYGEQMRRNPIRDKNRRFFETLFYSLFGFGSSLAVSYTYKRESLDEKDGYGIFNFFTFIHIFIYFLFICAFLDYEPVIF